MFRDHGHVSRAGIEVRRRDDGIGALPAFEARIKLIGLKRSRGEVTPRIEIDDVSRPQVLALLEEHLHNMYELTPPDQVFAFDASKLRQPGVVFWTAWEGE
jgi:hypothetical protein